MSSSLYSPVPLFVFLRSTGYNHILPLLLSDPVSSHAQTLSPSNWLSVPSFVTSHLWCTTAVPTGRCPNRSSYVRDFLLSTRTFHSIELEEKIASRSLERYFEHSLIAINFGCILYWSIFLEFCFWKMESACKSKHEVVNGYLCCVYQSAVSLFHADFEYIRMRSKLLCMFWIPSRLYRREYT